VIDDLWYKNAVIYCLDVGTFMDSTGDGIGDFQGLSRRLDYLAGLGVTCVWLLPFQPTPDRDNGYDVADYYGVDPSHGSLGDFVELSHEAKGRGIRVIMDLVINHTSDKHRWFQEARRDAESRYREFYVWSKKKPPGADRGMVFPGVQKSTWSYDDKARAYYFHRFYDFQPDLDTSAPAVQEELRKVMGFWLELGVAGFRVDALPFVIENKRPDQSGGQRYEYLHEMRDFLQWRCGDAVMLAEANVTADKDENYFGADGDRMHMMFNFQVNQNLFYALATADVRPLVRALERTRALPPTAQWAHFLRNNDELDLGRLTPAQQQRVFAAFGPDKDMQLYDRGIRRRLAPMLGGDQRRLELAYSLLFTLPGTPVIRYGDEIGMGDDLSLPEREAARTVMQWSNSANGGFSIARRIATPVIADGPFGYPHVNVAEQRRDPGSLLNWTERLIRLRKECPELGWGAWRALDPGTPGVLALRFDWRGNAVVAVHNLAAEARETTLKLPDHKGEKLVNLLAYDNSAPDRRGTHKIELPAYGYRWYRVGSLNDLQTREPA
jgi:maltose alpha-D-glucosyltransferase/alpha-amylase